MGDSGLYIHIPYCKHKCLYCDFYSGGSRIADWDLYVQSLLNELRLRKNELSDKLSTIYIGGGTPSLMEPVVFRKLIEGVNREFGEIGRSEEFTIEANPDDVTPEKCRLWKEAGVNRVSLGIQSLQDKELRLIGRRHNSKDAVNAYGIISEFFDNVSVDLMFGLPGQTLSRWENTVEETIGLKPRHISSYSLMQESGTALTLLYNQGKIDLPAEEETLQMWKLLTEKLEAAGYLQYEISNYSLPDYESRHNMLYWSGKPYLGLGPSACSYDGKTVRNSNPADIKKYISYYSNPEILSSLSSGKLESFGEKEVLDVNELKTEMIMTRLRRMQGLDLEEYREKFGKLSVDKLREKASRFIENGTLIIEGEKLRLTKEGIMVSDSVFVGLME